MHSLGTETSVRQASDYSFVFGVQSCPVAYRSLSNTNQKQVTNGLNPHAVKLPIVTIG